MRKPELCRLELILEVRQRVSNQVIKVNYLKDTQIVLHCQRMGLAMVGFFHRISIRQFVCHSRSGDGNFHLFPETRK